VVSLFNQDFTVLTTREIEVTVDELLHTLLSLPSERNLGLLDSCGTHKNGSHLLIAGIDPFGTIELYHNEARIYRPDKEPIYISNKDPLSLIDTYLATLSLKDSLIDIPVTAVCFVTLSYELIYQLERLRTVVNHDWLHRLVATFTFYKTVFVYDYLRERTIVVSLEEEEELDRICKEITESRRKSFDLEDVSSSNLISNFSYEEYIAAVCKLKEHIYAGDIYQTNLTQQFSCTLTEDTSPEQIFLRLRQNNPAPFSAFIRRYNDTIISASPERFLSVSRKDDERFIEAWPIKGTQRRGRSSEEDEHLRQALLNSEKDRAENIMIVDLLRNDLGRVCEYGSIHVKELCTIEEHPTLFHLVSKVEGKLRKEVSIGDIIKATFPCGSITGAPKIRAMELLSEIETLPRGISMGAIGYASLDGRLDLNVAIRTMTISGKMATFNVGGGIVVDSDPTLEYEESLLKARALLAALNIKNKE
jgi:para-aminobenzoate synthetase component I